MSKIRPIPIAHGVGFTSLERLPQYAQMYDEKNTGRYWNYHVTTDCQDWPEKFGELKSFTIDGFSPNLNKSLHVGHLRQLAIANALRVILPNSKFVSLLGASQGVIKSATDELDEWFKFLNYHPKLYYDVLMPMDVVESRLDTDPQSRHQGCHVYDGPNGQVITIRSDGRPTYSFSDLAFSKIVAPTHYITGAEQKEHFANLGLGEKHLPMGLVLGKDGKKMKSRTGDGVLAKEILQEIKDRFDPTPDPERLAWNVVAWNFLHVSRTQNVKYNPEDWTRPDSPGMYITYTYARILSALGESDVQKGIPIGLSPHVRKGVDKKFKPKERLLPDQYLYGNPAWYTEVAVWSKENPDSYYDLTQADAELIGFANQYHYYKNLSVENMDLASLANFAYDLACKLGTVYHTEKIQGGRYGFVYAVTIATNLLCRCIVDLGMFPLTKV